MTTVTVKVPDKADVEIPAKLVAWFRSEAIGHLCADMDLFPALNQEVNESNLTDNTVRLNNVRALLDALGYADEPGTEDVSITLDTGYLLPLARQIVGALGERMQEACGGYGEVPDLKRIADLCERGLWLVGLLDEVVPGWPEFGEGGEG